MSEMIVTPPNDALQIQVDDAGFLSYAVHQNDVPLIQQISLVNLTDNTCSDLHIKVLMASGHCKPWEARIDSIPPHGTHRLEQIQLELEPARLASQNEREKSQLVVEVTSGSTMLARWTGPMDVLAFNEWHGTGSLIELTAAYILPNHPQVQTILSNASKILRKNVPHASLDGYQSNSAQHVAQIIYAIYLALADLQIGYINPPASFENAGQKVRFPDDMIQYQLGTCLDLSMLFAACIEQAGLNPLLIITQGHAFVGVWMHDTHFAFATMDEPSSLTKRADLKEIMLLESTLLTHQPVPPLDRCLTAGRMKLNEPENFVCAIDIKAARSLLIRPLPVRTILDGQMVVQVQSDANASMQSMPEVERILYQHAPVGKTDLVEVEAPAVRIERWKRKLLDMTLRNRVLNYNHNSKRAVPLYGNMLAELEDQLAAGRSFKFYSTEHFSQLSQLRAKTQQSMFNDDLVRHFMQDMLDQRLLPSDLSEKEMDGRLLELFRSARTEVEESGVSPMYLAMGMLKWYESSTSDKPRYAPILLLPVQLTRKSASAPFELSQTDDDPHINITLLQKLKEFGLVAEGLDELLTDESGLDIPGIFGRFRALIVDVPRWDIVEEAHLGLFSFTKFLMWRDLEQRSHVLMKNHTVRHLVDRPDEPFDDGAAFTEPCDLDLHRLPAQTFCPLDADSSQLAAIYAAHDGKNFVLEGPPGTGKSQTITNLIAHCLGHGKRVLFVAEKQAALNVVHKRISDVGLGPFVLELHSHKANKREVLNQLQEALNTAGMQTPVAWDQLSDELQTTRTKLNEVVNTMHAQRPIGMSVFTALSKIMALPDEPRLNMAIPNPGMLTAEQYGRWMRLAEDLANASRLVEPAGRHPLRGIVCQTWTPALPQAIAQLCLPVHQVTLDIAASSDRFRRVLGLKFSGNPNRLTLDWLCTLGQHLLKKISVASALLKTVDWASLHKQLRHFIDMGLKRDDLHRRFMSQFQTEVLALPLVEMLGQWNLSTNQWFLPRMLTQRRIGKQLRVYLLPGNNSAEQNVADVLAGLLEYKRLHAQLADPACPAAAAFNSYWNCGYADWQQLDQQLQWAGVFHSLLDQLPQLSLSPESKSLLVDFASSQRESFKQGTDGRQVLENLANQLTELDKLLGHMQQSTYFDMTMLAGLPTESDYLGRIHRRSNRLRENIGKLNDWCYWQRVRHTALLADLKALVIEHEQGRIPIASIQPSLQRALLDAWINAIWQDDAVLRELNIHEHSKRIERFKQLDMQHLKCAQTKVRNTLSQQIPHQNISGNMSNSEMGLLAHQLKLKRRHMSVRKLIGKLPNVLPRLKPCLLMSPLSVAQYLDADYPPFDVVIFDEASQIPVWDAVGAIARGSQVIVVGDSKQLPPTNFFARQDNDEEDEEELEDLESILDECAAAGMPTRQLLWHYRSRHESLIAFSNYHYYDNHLYTFPNAIEETTHLGVSLHYVTDGVYDRSKARNNVQEAKAIVAEVVHRLTHTQGKEPSIGIVTFSLAQQTLVEDLLDEARREHPQIERYFSTDYTDHVFVKNLENVQGDERSVILFSICYARDLSGRMAMNFGPLNREGGQRRLNVAITRAREQVVVFSSIHADDIDLSRSNKLGVRHLKAFLDYAKRGYAAISQAHHVDQDAACESPFEEQVMQKLVERGWQVVPQVGCSGYRIDLGVKHPDQPGRFILGIECDGATYHSGQTARDRDRLRQAVLENLGWTMHRVWSTQWWSDPQQQLERIEQAIAQAMQKDRAQLSEPVIEEEPLWKDQDDPQLVHPSDADKLAGHAGEHQVDQLVALPACALFYEVFTTKRKVSDTERFYQDHRYVAELIEDIIKVEAPMSRRLLARRLMPLFGMGRQTNRVDARIDQMLETMGNVLFVMGNDIWLKSQQPDQYEGFRIPQGESRPREIDDVPIAELANAAHALLKHAISIPKDDLCRETARLFGMSKLTSKNQPQLEEAITFMTRRGQGAVTEGNVKLL